jgi:wyosine [tRNA(Phe)-imidazoG37] synthetase (radical SAM superfamily)
MKNKINSGYRYIFGPVPSRRLGVSLGVDLLPAKICTLDCIYCECGKTKTLTTCRKEYVPSDKVESEIRDYLSGNPGLDYITFSGSGEPTLHSCIGELINFLKCDYPRYRVALLTNGTLLNEPAVLKQVLDADLVKVSLDSGLVESFARINRPHSALELSKITDGLINFRNIYQKELWVEVFLVKNINDNETELGKIKDFLKLIRPDKIHLNTLDRPGTESWVEAVEKSVMENIAGYFEDARIIGRPDSKGSGFSGDITGFITATVKRRPCTAADVSRILNITDDEAEKYLEILSEKGEIGKKIMPRGVFYFGTE